MGSSKKKGRPTQDQLREVLRTVVSMYRDEARVARERAEDFKYDEGGASEARARCREKDCEQVADLLEAILNSDDLRSFIVKG